MSLRRQIVILKMIVLMTGLAAYGQTETNECDTIYEFAETMPKYGQEDSELMEYFNKNVVTVLSDCYEREAILISRIYAILTISREGNVIDVEFKKLHATEECREFLKEKILKMKGWTSAKQGNRKVCCRFKLPITINLK